MAEGMDSICCCFIAFIICATANVRLLAPALTSVHSWQIIYSERTAPNHWAGSTWRPDRSRSAIKCTKMCAFSAFSTNVNTLVFDYGMYFSEKSRVCRKQPGLSQVELELNPYVSGAGGGCYVNYIYT